MDHLDRRKNGTPRFRSLRLSVLHQRYKDFYFLLIAQATRPNYWVKKLRHSRRSRNRHRLDLHLGCGPKYLPGFVNIDANPTQKSDMWLDVRCGLPFASASVDSIYSTHMIEHLYPDELEKLLLECVRVLKAGAGCRIIVPSLSNAILAFQQNRHDWFYDDFPRHFDSLGGRFFPILCSVMDSIGRLSTSALSTKSWRRAGFKEVVESAEGKSRLYEGTAFRLSSPVTRRDCRIRFTLRHS